MVGNECGRDRISNKQKIVWLTNAVQVKEGATTNGTDNQKKNNAQLSKNYLQTEDEHDLIDKTTNCSNCRQRTAPVLLYF